METEQRSSLVLVIKKLLVLDVLAELVSLGGSSWLTTGSNGRHLSVFGHCVLPDS